MLATAVTQWGQNQNEIASFFAKKNPKKPNYNFISTFFFVKDGTDRLSGK